METRDKGGKAIIIAILLPAIFVLSYTDVFSAFPAADKVLVIKSKRIMMLLKDGDIIKTYKVALGKNPVGKKIYQGDKKTPEGTYILDYKNPESSYHLSIHISYPNELDAINAKKNGLRPGGDVAIHGLSKDRADFDKLHNLVDWTDGCIAVTNKEMEEIWQLVSVGTPIVIKP
ncbi:MAG: L,D-transpeptidase family protein [Nitrospirae bacterium]|nr:L,D-transpeptidase family protein [Nitrospirota bacterium]